MYYFVLLLVELIKRIKVGTTTDQMAVEQDDVEKPVNAQPNQSFRHLFSFGGADVKPVPKPEPRPAAPVVPTRKRPREEPKDEPAPATVADLSDPEDVEDEVLACARAFCRGERTEAAIHTEWTDGGRQERLKADFRLAHRKLARGNKTTKGERTKSKR